jgi:hypothetical protein
MSEATTDRARAGNGGEEEEEVLPPGWRPTSGGKAGGRGLRLMHPRRRS